MFCQPVQQDGEAYVIRSRTINGLIWSKGLSLISLIGIFGLLGLATSPALAAPCAPPTLSAPCAYITDAGSETVSVIDLATNMVVATMPVGQRPIGVAVHPSGSFVYVANNAEDTVSVIGTATK